MAVLVDSSVWIAGSKPTTRECHLLRSMIHEGMPLYTTLPVKTEICQGARTQDEFQRLWDGLSGFPSLHVSEELWEQSAWNYFRCRKQGITPSTIDCLIATITNAYRAKLWTLDKIFVRLQPIIGFDIFLPGN